ncbi:uncharacterized protein LOC125659217 [Ostrea edulis]|uniref:uncharacterized protein LOC125659217 n=1 Tax=Ostrea edulis TaxID=37623 RepID=UPI0024AECCAE|nr:uncharacterized protein LOC125659217 [Ostrea edulis]
MIIVFFCIFLCVLTENNVYGYFRSENGNTEATIAFKEEIVSVQQEQINFLMTKVSELSDVVQHQKLEMTILKKEKENLVNALSDIKVMQALILSTCKLDHGERLKFESENKHDSSASLELQYPDLVAETLDFHSRKERLLLSQPPTHTNPTSGNVIAFYAYMSGDFVNPGASRTLIFDKIITNAGNGYHNATGAFVVPKTGYYVFSWSMRLVNGEYHRAELVHNHNVMGVAYLYAPTGDHTVSNTIVIHVNQGDDVFIRTQSGANSGDVESGTGGRTEFSGWKLN